MKLSQLNTEEALDLLCEITPYVANIVADKDIMDAIGKAVNKEGMTKAGVLMAGVDRITKLAPVLLKTHRPDVIGIIAAVNRRSAEDIAKQNVLKTMEQIVDIFKDKELLAFFKSCAEQEESA